MKSILHLLSYVAFPFFVILFIASLCFWDLVQKVARYFGSKSLDKAVYGLNYGMLCTLYFLGTKVRLAKSPDVDPNKPCIIVSNHQSMYDMPLLYLTFYKFRPRYIAKQELRTGIPGISVCLRETGAALIDRGNPRSAIEEIVQLGKRMKLKNYSAIIFPEGTRAKDGEIKKFRESGLKALLKELPNAKVLPVVIDGTWRITKNKYGPIPFGLSIRIVPGEPISRQGKSHSEVIKETEKVIRAMYETLRNG